MAKYSIIGICSLLAILLYSCGNGNNWSIEGNIKSGDSVTLYLEAPGLNGWYAMDSVILDKSGDFKFTQPAIGYPEILRLKTNGKVVYFPIDSIETIVFNGYVSALDSSYTLSGSTSAEMMMTIDRKISETIKKGGEEAIATDSVLKRELSGMILGDNVGLISYYIINKRVGKTTIFDPTNKKDIRIIGAVANKFNQQRPNDPRTKSLKDIFIQNRRVSTIADGDTIHIAQTALFDIKLYDEKGVLQSLQEVTSKGNVTILNFTIYSDNNSPAFNIALNKIYESNKSAGLQIYQVSVDEDEYFWKKSAENLPWITVYNSHNDGAKNLMNYNVTLLPASFIINRNGELVERVDDVAKLETAIKKYL